MHRWMIVAISVGLGAIALAADPPSYAIPHPHPMLTEVLFNVPPGDEGDANKDGQRSAAGDEFIEVANPYDHSINLAGYVLSSRLSSPGKDTGKGVRFVFPDVELGAHNVALVFNGYDSKISGSVGTHSTAPESSHPDFDGAIVFTMQTRAKTRALRNSGDFILLSAPDGTPLDCVVWGDSVPPPPSDVIRLAKVDTTVKGSVQRLSPDGPMLAHREIDERPFSPGEIPQP